MKILSTLFIGLFSVMCFAQLTVKPNGTSDDNFIYVKDEVLYVKEDVNLLANNHSDTASIYLRYEGQLIQGSNVENTGDGTLSVFQEGDANNWAYNYWASPVGLTSGSGNSNFGVELLHTPETTLISQETQTISGYDSNAGPPTQIARYWIWRFSGGTAYADWIYVGDGTTVQPGEGFTMKGVSGTDSTPVDGRVNNPGNEQRYDFRGRPHNGTIDIDLAADSEYLVGNPYPSALDLSYFLLENSVNDDDPTSSLLDCTDDTSVTRRNAITGIAYFWDSDPSVQSHYLVHYKGGYGAFAPVDCSTPGIYVPAAFYMYNEDGESTGESIGTGSDSYARRYSPIGQGFIVKTVSGTPENLQFKNTHRVFEKENATTSVFHRYATDATNTTENVTSDELVVIPKFKVNVAFSNQYTRQLALAFWPTATDEVDPAMDAKNLDGLSSDIGWLHENENYVIDVRQFDVEQQIPLYLDLQEQKTLEFRANNFENFDTENVYIFDKITQQYHSIKDQAFTITLSAGNYNERFRVTFLNAEDQGGLDIKDEINEAFDIFQDNEHAQLHIKNPHRVEVKSIGLYDLAGREIFMKRNVGNQPSYAFPTNNLQQAIYIAKIVTSDNKQIAKKVSIFNRN